MRAIRALLACAILSSGAVARAQADDDCSDCQIDLTVDECALPGAECQPEQELTDEQLAQVEETDAPAEPDDAPDALVLSCPDGAQAIGGHCVDESAAMGNVAGGCSSTRASGPASLLLLIVVAALLRLRRRYHSLGLVLLALALGCVAGDGSWDAALGDGPPADAAGKYLDVFSGERTDGDGSLFGLAGQPLEGAAAREPAFALSRGRLDGARALRRVSTPACGDRIVASELPGDGELMGWAASQPTFGTAPLSELLSPDGCGAVYQTDAEAAQLFLDQGWTPGPVIGYVWPPGWGGAPPVDEVQVASESVVPCKLGPHPNLFLFYTGTGRDTDPLLLKGCPGEVVLGEKHMDHPLGAFAGAAAHAAGGRSALVFGGNGKQFRDMLSRSNGVERTAAFIRARLAKGYDYVVIDEVTTDPSWRDGSTVNHRFRQLLTRIPGRKLIAYISLDLTMYPGGGQAMHDRRFLLRALKLRGRALALEDYLHTGPVINGAAPSVFRTAADRLVAAVHGMKGAPGISLRTITTLGLSMHTAYPQYNYLDQPAHDLAAITREASAIRHGSGRLRAERGLGFYFVGRSDITPSGHSYSVNDLVARIHRAMLTF